MNRLYPVPLLYLLAALPLAAVQPPPAQTPAGAPAARSAPQPAPSPTPSPVLEGTVKGPDGKPVEGALVIARSPGVDEPALSARTDAAGRFRLTVRKPVPHVVRVEARGFAGRTIEKARPGSPLDVVLARGAVLEGTVRDGATGQPVAQARVQGQEEAALSLPWEPSAGMAETTTDAKGRFRLEGLSSGPQTVRARASGYGMGRQLGAVPGRPVDVYLFPASTISGTVWGPGNVALAGAVVRADSDLPFFRYRGGPRPVVTDGQGRYEIDGLEPGIYRVVARHKDFAPGVVASVPVERGGDARADVVLDKGAAVSGRLVTGPEPQPVAGRVVVQEIDGQRSPQAMRDVLRAEAGADGRFQLDAIPAGSHALAVTAPGYASKRVEVQVAPSARQVSIGDVELEPGLTIRGRVRDRAGAPVAEATVSAFPSRPMPSARVQASSEADGSFVLAGLEPGTQRLSALASGYAPAQRMAEAGAEKVELVLSPAGSIAGTVVDDGGRPIEVFNVSARPAGPERNEGMVLSTPSFRSVTSADGRFLLENLGQGTYVVEANAPERASASVSQVKVAAGSTTDAGTIRLTAGGTIRGTVADAATMPVPGANIRVRGPGMDFMSFGSGPQAVSDPAGAFELKGVPLGTVEVSASHPSYAEGRVSGIEVDPAKGPAEARIVLAQGGRIDGWVGRRDGSPIAGAYVRVFAQRPGGGPTFSSEGPGLLVTNADGTFVVEHVPAGRVSVNLMSRSGSRFIGAQSKELDVREGEASQVEFRSREILVSGHVTRSGTPLPGARITLRGDRSMMMVFGSSAEDVAAVPSGPQRMTAVTGEDGGYELIVDEPGRARVIIESVDGRVTYPMRTAEIPDADAYTLDLAFTGVTVAGVVVDRNTEQPVPRARVFASRKKPDPASPGGSGAQTGEDGRFQIELEPGEYRVRASAENYGSAEVDTTVGSGGGSELRIALGRGASLSGKVVDVRGRGIGGLRVFASPSERGVPSGGFATTLPDGTFSMGGLISAPHRVVAESDLGAFAVGTDIRPGDKDVVLTLRPGGRVTIRVLGPDGQPVAGIFATAEGLPISARTDGQGMTEMIVPAGSVELRARKDRLEGRATVTVAEGGTVAVELQLAAAPAEGSP